jgi:hypothetical protein
VSRRTDLTRSTAIRALLDHPALAATLPSLPPRALARLYDTVGVRDAGELMAMTPPAQLARALDEAVWTEQADRTRFDPDVFVDWLEVWLGEGETFAAERLLALDEDFLALCVGAVVTVRDSHVDGFHRWASDDGDVPDPWGAETHPGNFTAVIERFVVAADRDDEWDVVEPALNALWSHAPDRLLRLLERLTADGSRMDGEEFRPRFLSDAAGARDDRREHAGFVPQAAARAFLGMAHALTVAELVAMSDYDAETARHLNRLGGNPPADVATGGEDDAPAGVAPPGEATAEAEAHARPPAGHRPPPHTQPADVWLLLRAAGVTEDPVPAALLSGPDSERLTLRSRLDALSATDPDALAKAASELAFLANVLLAMDVPATAGSASRREAHAREVAFATASLGIELLESGYHREVRPGRPPGLVPSFLLAWRTMADLPGRVVQAFERALVASDAVRFLEARDWLRAEVQEGVRDLAAAVRDGRFETAREAVGVLSLAFHTDTCRALSSLLDVPPRFPGLVEGAGKDSSRWIRSMTDLEQLARLLKSLRAKADERRAV